MNKALEWIKAHPTESLLAVGAIGGLVLFMRGGSGGSGSSVGTIANAQLQLANLNNQNALQQAQIQAQENTAAYAAQVQNNQTAAELAAVAAQYQAGIQTAQIAAEVQDRQTNATTQVATTQISAEQQAYNAQLEAEKNALKYQYDYLAQAQQEQVGMVEDLAPYVKSFNGSQNRLAYLQTLVGSPSAAIATQESYAAVNNPAYSPTNILLSQAGSLAKTVAGLFA